MALPRSERSGSERRRRCCLPAPSRAAPHTAAVRSPLTNGGPTHFFPPGQQHSRADSLHTAERTAAGRGVEATTLQRLRIGDPFLCGRKNRSYGRTNLQCSATDFSSKEPISLATVALQIFPPAAFIFPPAEDWSPTDSGTMHSNTVAE